VHAALAAFCLPHPPPASAVPEAERQLPGFFKGDSPQSGSD